MYVLQEEQTKINFLKEELVQEIPYQIMALQDLEIATILYKKWGE